MLIGGVFWKAFVCSAVVAQGGVQGGCPAVVLASLCLRGCALEAECTAEVTFMGMVFHFM